MRFEHRVCSLSRVQMRFSDMVLTSRGTVRLDQVPPNQEAVNGVSACLLVPCAVCR